MEHFLTLHLRVIDQTQRRVYNEESVPSCEKIVSIFEPHTDIIVKGDREVHYGHKINLATQQDGFIVYLNIEKGNPADMKGYLKPVRRTIISYPPVLWLMVAMPVGRTPTRRRPVV